MNTEIVFRWIAHSSLTIYICVLVVLLCFLRKAIRNQPTQFIYATLCFWLLLATKDIAYFVGDTWYDSQICNVLMSIDLWPTPIIAILLFYTLQSKWLSLWRMACMFVPFFIFTLLSIITKGSEVVFIVNQLYGFAFATVFGVIVLILSYKCNGYVNANYSDKKQIDVRWVRNLTILMYVICALWMLMSFLASWLADAIYYLLTTVLTASLFYYTMHHKEVVFPNYMNIGSILSLKIEEKMPEIEDPKENLVLEQQFANIEQKLEVAINVDKIYLNPQLTLTDLAKQIGTNRTYLSRYINNYKATPFINFINDFRCTEAERLLTDASCSLSLTEVSEKCGFASYSTFRRVFKQKYGYAPSQCRKS